PVRMVYARSGQLHTGTLSLEAPEGAVDQVAEPAPPLDLDGGHVPGWSQIPHLELGKGGIRVDEKRFVTFSQEAGGLPPPRLDRDRQNDVGRELSAVPFQRAHDTAEARVRQAGYRGSSGLEELVSQGVSVDFMVEG